MALAAVAAVGVLVATVTFAAAWIVNTLCRDQSRYPRAARRPGPRTLALVQDAPEFGQRPGRDLCRPMAAHDRHDAGQRHAADAAAPGRNRR